MAATYAAADVDRPIRAVGGGYELVGTITFSGNYATGGDALDFGPIFKQIGVGTVNDVITEPQAGYSLDYDYVNKKLQAFAPDGTEHPAAAYNAALTAVPVKVLVKGA